MWVWMHEQERNVWAVAMVLTIGLVFGMSMLMSRAEIGLHVFYQGRYFSTALLFPYTEGTLCSFAFSCFIEQEQWQTKAVMVGRQQWTSQWNNGSMSRRCLVNQIFPLAIYFQRINLSNWASEWVIYFTSHWECLCFNFLKSRRSSCPTAPSLSSPSVWAQSTFFVFTPPLSVPVFPPLAAPDIAWCAEGMQLPEEFPPSSAHSQIHSLQVTQWVPLPFTSLCSPRHDNVVQFRSWLARSSA